MGKQIKMSFPRYPAPLSFIRPEDAEKLAKKTETDGFYYDQADGFYYDGFYYDGFARDNGFYYQGQQNRQVAKYQQGFYYDQEEKKWKDQQATPLNGKTKRSTRRLSMLLPRKRQRQLKPLRSRTSMLQTRLRAESSPSLPPSDLPTKLPKSG